MRVPMLNVLEFQGAVEVLDAAASPTIVDRALSAAGLSRWILSRQRGFLPYRLEAILVEGVARALGDRHLGARLSRDFKYASYDAYAQYVLGAADLRSALERGREAYNLINVGSEIVIREHGEHVLVGRSTCLSDVVGRHHLDDGTIFILERVVRYFLGPQWRADWIEIPGTDQSRAAFLEGATGSPVVLGCAVPAISVRRSELKGPNPIPQSATDTLTFRDVKTRMGVSPPDTYSACVLEVMRIEHAQGQLSEELVAHALAVGTRTMQRLLKAEGTSFRELKMRYSKMRACDLLVETDMTVEAISCHLGYAEANSFRRAFRGWTGLSPTEYRANKQARN